MTMRAAALVAMLAAMACSGDTPAAPEPVQETRWYNVRWELEASAFNGQELPGPVAPAACPDGSVGDWVLNSLRIQFYDDNPDPTVPDRIEIRETSAKVCPTVLLQGGSTTEGTYLSNQDSTWIVSWEGTPRLSGRAHAHDGGLRILTWLLASEVPVAYKPVPVG